ncbi:MAG: hypothetical protein ACOX0X_01410 [Candidatus Dojkabacteria bacterium]
MKSRVIFTISLASFIIIGVILIFVFKASGSNSSPFVGGCDPYNVEVRKGEGENSVVISWKSKQRCSGYVIYGSEMKDLRLVGIDLENEIKDTKHTVVVNSLVSTKTYFFSIISDGVSYGKEGLPISFSISAL